jgi:4-methoxybenzoate monooxygenase (O-demethylating)
MIAIQDSTRLLEPPTLDVDPFSDEVLTDPYPFFQLLRDAGPVAYIKQYGYYAVGRYAEVTTVASDFKRFTSEGGVGLSDIRMPGDRRVR